MHSSIAFLTDLALVLGVAALTSVLSHRLRLPPVFGYLVAGVIIGPTDFFPLVADVGTVRTLSELGVILLMFSLGLGFTLRKIARLASTAGLIAAVEIGLCLSLGYLVGQALGLEPDREPVRRGARGHLEHHDHREGVRGPAHRRARSRTSSTACW